MCSVSSFVTVLVRRAFYSYSASFGPYGTIRLAAPTLRGNAARPWPEIPVSRHHGYRVTMVTESGEPRAVW